jgi:hypothetical protein
MPVEPFKYHLTVIVKTWSDPEDRDQGLEVQTRHDFAHTKEEAEMMIRRMAGVVPDDVVQVLGFYTKITMVEQVLNT